MVDQELLLDSTESYLKSLFSEASGSLNSDFNSFAAFGELGINSFQVLKIIKALEADFGTLPKSLLFENFTINDLANYFVAEHADTLSAKFAGTPGGAGSSLRASDRQKPEVPTKAKPPAARRIGHLVSEPAPLLILERDAFGDAELAGLLRTLFERHKVEGCVSRGTRKIAPNLFIGSARQGYFNYGRSREIVLVYGYTGPRDQLPVLFEEMYRYCAAGNLQLNILAAEKVPSLDGTSFSATPFGVLQRISKLREFTLDGGSMRRLRYQVSKFQKSGACRTEEYRCGSNHETDLAIAEVIDRWCGSRAMVNPLVHDVRDEILAGALGSEHRVFLTYLDGVLQNVILITAMCSEENGYLMDLEFYLPDMPLGGLEFAIVQIIETLVREGCDVLSLGGTYGCKVEPSATADPAIDAILDDLRTQNIFNDAGNLQFKNKFRPETESIYLCRPVGSGKPENVIDIIMMIADPEKMQTPVEEQHVMPLVEAGEALAVDGNDRERLLAKFGFNPLNIPAEHVDFDLKTDSWAQLEMPAIQAQMRFLHGQLQQPVNVEDSLRAVFPFAHLILTRSGQAAEHIFFKAWPRQGVVLQNLLFPSTIFHQIDKGFTPREVPHAEIFRLNSEEPYKGNMSWDALQTQVAQEPAAIACVCIEVSDNASGGHPVSMRHLKDVKALLAGHSIPLVVDATRVLENAQFVIEHDEEQAGKSVWAVVREILSCADAVIGSLSKDFGVNKGGIIATNDAKLFQRLQELLHEEGAGIDLIDGKLIALSLKNRKYIEANVLRRMESVRRIWCALRERDVPVVQPAGGHCVLVDVKQIPEFQGFEDPVASFLAWLYLNTGIRGGAHSAGMQQHTAINDLVRLAIPLGLKSGQIDSVIERLVQAFDEKVSIPEIVRESRAPQPFGGVHANFKLIKYHNAPTKIVAATDIPSAPRSLTASSQPAPGFSSREIVAAATLPEPGGSARADENTRPRRTQDVAIVGMAGRYPKAKNLRELWDNLAQGRDCIEEMPADRYERRLQYESLERYRGGFIDDIDKFDSLFFNISPREAEMLDPQERLFLEVAWEAIEDAGYYPEVLAQEDGTRQIGVFVGAVWAMYQLLGVEEKHLGNKTVPNSFLWSIANRVSYVLNLSGPSLTVDTACSSSLTALYLACEAIQAGQCSAALVGGVNLDLHQARFDINHQGGALSPDGVCRTFGKGANGYVMGEGVGALFLKPFDRAVQDGDHIYGVIKSAVVNHGGRTGGYTVPNPKAQASLISAALEKADVVARSIGYIEAHGTGTALGDPVEITGLSSAFSADNVENQTCAIGSVKTNIGHLEAAAGIVGVTKVLLQMKHRQLVPSLHSSELSEFIDFEKSPFYVAQKLEDWKARELDGVRFPLRAGISSFGAGGSNAHIILEDYEPPQPAGEEPAPAQLLIFPLSARSEDSLREAAVRLSQFIEQNDVDLNAAAYTLQRGRKSFEHRVVIIAATKEELIEKLTCFVDGKKSQDVASGQAKGSEGVLRLLNRRDKQEFVRLVSQGAAPHKMAGLWTEGLFDDWHGYPSNGAGQRISLPTYPFADRRHWVSERSLVRRALQPAGVHPMVDSNESTFERQLFKKTFSERDFFMYDHHISDIATLPGVSYLELARKVGEIAANRKVRKIRNIIWISPTSIQKGATKEVFIELKPSGTTVQFEAFSEGPAGNKVPHSQGTLVYATAEEEAAEPEYIDLEGIRARCAKVIDGKTAYPIFKTLGLNLGPSLQVVQDVYKNETETLGGLKLPEFRHGDMQSMVLHPSLMDGSLQAGMAAQLGGQGGEMLVPFSFGEVEIIQPLQTTCYCYVTQPKEDDAKKGKTSVVMKSNVVIVDETGKILVKIRDSVGVPLREVHKKAPTEEVFSPLYYSYDWENAPLAAATEKQTRPHSLVLFDTDEALRDLADQVILVRPGEAFADEDGQSYTVNPRNKDDFTRLFESLIEKGSPVENICFAWPRHEQDLNESLERGVYSFLFLCQALINRKLESAVQLFYLYSGKEGEAQPHNEAVGGFVNTLRLEHPKLLCKTLEIRQEGDAREPILDAISTELQARMQDATAVRYEAGERFIRKLKAFELEEASPESKGIRENGVVLITGGAGGLGLIFAEYLAREHKARVVLTGRSALSPEREARLDELRKGGAEVLYLPADVSNVEEVRNLVNETRSRFGRINGVIHAAGVLRDSLIRNKTPEEMSAVLAPKVYGTVHLDELTKDEDLDFFVTFSSLAAVKGNGGQCDYSFANHFMDSFASERERRRAEGARSGQTLSLNWSIWADGGMKLDEQTEVYFKKNLGISPLSTAMGTDAFVRGLASGRSQFAVLEGIQEKVELAWGLRKKQPSPAMAAVIEGGGEDLLAPLLNDLSEIVMSDLKLEAGDVAHDKVLTDLGYDSIGLTGFANAVNEKYQLDITPVLFFDYSTLDDIAGYLIAERRDEILRFYHGPAADATAATPPAAREQQAQAGHQFAIRKGWDPAAGDRPAMSRSSAGGPSPENRFFDEPIAIVGMSGVMPLSEDVDEFWDNLQNSRDLISVVPPDRWRWEDYDGDPRTEANKSNSKWGGFMKEVDKFDAQFFGISAREAQMMDPQQRIFLQTVWKAIEDSGQRVSDLSGTRTGLFVGVTTNDYVSVMSNLHVDLDLYTGPGNTHSILANRVSFQLNLHGPSSPIDTACSSSLIALHRAVQSIRTGACDMAIVGGVNAMLSPGGHISFAMAGLMSSDGKCRSFDKQGNGYARGEGCGAIFVKPLSVAEADGNHIYAVVKATAENHGGRVAMLTAPNASAQSALLVEAYEKARIDPATVGYIECHATGTSLGDPIEVQALNRAFAELYKRQNKPPAARPHCGLSCVKSNVGHLETASGMASLLKVLLAIKHKQIPATIHFQEINPYIKLNGTPFYVVDKLTEWEAPMDEDGAPLPRRAGVSAFGFGGANGHIVLEEYVPPKRTSPSRAGAPELIVLSAKNGERLDAYIRTMLAYLEKGEVELEDFAYTLQAGRDEMPERVALLAASIDDLKQKFGQILAGERPADSYRGTVSGKAVPPPAADVQGVIEQNDLSKLAELWIAGAKIDWRLLHTSGVPRRLSVPTYPFAKDRHWLSIPETQTGPQSSPAQNAVSVARLHPLLHVNASTLSQQSYRSILTGTELYLKDHQVAMNGHGAQKVLPGAAYLEMARAAIEAATSIPHASSVVELEDTIWGDPMVVDGNTQATIALLANDSGQIHYEIYSGEGEQEVVHCQGRTVLSERPAATVLDLDELRAQMRQGQRNTDDVYADFAMMGLHYGPAHRTITAVHHGDHQLLARLSLPAVFATAGSNGSNSGYVLHPSVMTGAVQAGIRLIADPAPRSETPLFPHRLGRLRVLSACTDEMFVWARHAQGAGPEGSPIDLDIDLLDMDGRVCVEMRGLSFHAADAATEAGVDVTWLFGPQPPAGEDAAAGTDSMGAAEKMELFLKQEMALQLHKPMEDIPVDENYFDLGMTSLVVALLVQKTSRLLDEDLSPSALLEYSDIRGLASYLAATYPAKTDALAVVKHEGQVHSGKQRQIQHTNLTRLPRKQYLSVRAAAPAEEEGARADMNPEQILATVLWQEASPEDGYDTMTF
ncbi:MAG TPA: SDR family NAD(P)-dependent oxidoreductase [Thermoanaerobaculia bacterium]|nr:SDR family NAD(P)-dependent oxidoreductase [Thermoanaerobaculia bacterium]